MYTKFEESKPIISDAGSEQIDAMRNNLMALRDAVVAGTLVDWAQEDVATTKGSGTEENPDEIIWKKGAEWIRAAITWGSSGGEDGNPTNIVYSYSSDTGSSYDTLGTWAGNYNSNGTLTSDGWT